MCALYGTEYTVGGMVRKGLYRKLFTKKHTPTGHWCELARMVGLPSEARAIIQAIISRCGVCCGPMT